MVAGSSGRVYKGVTSWEIRFLFIGVEMLTKGLSGYIRFIFTEWLVRVGVIPGQDMLRVMGQVDSGFRR
jgi:hypothetical protein